MLGCAFGRSLDITDVRRQRKDIDILISIIGGVSVQEIDTDATG